MTHQLKKNKYAKIMRLIEHHFSEGHEDWKIRIKEMSEDFVRMDKVLAMKPVPDDETNDQTSRFMIIAQNEKLEEIQAKLRDTSASETLGGKGNG